MSVAVVRATASRRIEPPDVDELAASAQPRPAATRTLRRLLAVLAVIAAPLSITLHFRIYGVRQPMTRFPLVLMHDVCRLFRRRSIPPPPRRRRSRPSARGSRRSRPQMLVQGACGSATCRIDGDTLYWVESRPEEEGRYVIVRRTPDGKIDDVLPPPFSARTTGPRIRRRGAAGCRAASCTSPTTPTSGCGGSRRAKRRSRSRPRASCGSPILCTTRRAIG